MTARITIRDGTGTGHIAKVTRANELIVSGIGDCINTFWAMSIANQAYNFFIPKIGFNFRITSILFSTPASATTIDIYEASSVASLTIDKQILKVDISSKGFYPVNFPFGGFVPVAEGTFLNAKTDNTTVNMTIIGFYRPI